MHVRAFNFQAVAMELLSREMIFNCGSARFARKMPIVIQFHYLPTLQQIFSQSPNRLQKFRVEEVDTYHRNLAYEFIPRQGSSITDYQIMLPETVFRVLQWR